MTFDSSIAHAGTVICSSSAASPISANSVALAAYPLTASFVTSLVSPITGHSITSSSKSYNITAHSVTSANSSIIAALSSYHHTLKSVLIYPVANKYVLTELVCQNSTPCMCYIAIIAHLMCCFTILITQ